MIHEDIDSMEAFFQKVVRIARADTNEQEDTERGHAEQIAQRNKLIDDLCAKEHALRSENQRLRDLAQTVVASKDAEIAQVRSDNKDATAELRGAYAKIALLQSRLHRISKDIQPEVDEFRTTSGVAALMDDQRPLALQNNRENH